MKVFIPENLNIDLSKHADKYYYILSTLTYRMIFDKTLNLNSFIPARSKIWHDVINSRYKKRVNELIEMGIIEVKDSYWAGEISKRYRLKKPYRKAKMRQVTIKDERIIRRANKHRAKRIDEMTYPQHNFIYENLTKTEIDINGARKLLDETNFEETKKNYYSLMLDYFNDKNWFWKIGETGRIYNNATCLPKIFRGLLTYQNKHLVEVDVRTSQPFIMNLPIREYLALKISDISFNTNSSTISKLTSYPIYVTTFPDIELYKELTTNGTFYDYLIENFIKGCEPADYLLDDLSYYSDRDEFKEKLFGRIFYCFESGSWTTNENEQFKEMFPNVARIISYYKKESYKDLPRLLQSIESEIMIKNVVGRLMAENIYCLTIHDSVLCLPEYADKVKSIMEEEFQKTIGLKPQIRIK